METDIFDQMAENWPSMLVARTEIKNFTGGLYSPGYMANHDSAGTGPETVKMRRKVAYIKNSLVNWLRKQQTK